MRYYFHVCTVGEMVRDRDGREFDDAAAAKAFAARYAKLLQSKAAYCRIAFRVIEIRSTAGKLVATVPFANNRAPPRAIPGRGLSLKPDGTRWPPRSIDGRGDGLEPGS
jgi:hypothetical protein